jgi:hypothetical protein
VAGWRARLGLATGAGAVATAALMALGPLLGGVLLLIRHSLELAGRIGNLASESARTLATVRRSGAGLEQEIRQTFRQLEALQNLSAVLPAGGVLPATRGWAASPDLLVVLVDLVISGRPSLVVECGSGASTLWLAWRCGGSGSTAGSSRSTTTRCSAAGPAASWPGTTSATWPRSATPRWSPSASTARPTPGTRGAPGRT